ncbi:unnamed protein product, partial [Rhizoctonia solani]
RLPQLSLLFSEWQSPYPSLVLPVATLTTARLIFPLAAPPEFVLLELALPELVRQDNTVMKANILHSPPLPMDTIPSPEFAPRSPEFVPRSRALPTRAARAPQISRSLRWKLGSSHPSHLFLPAHLATAPNIPDVPSTLAAPSIPVALNTPVVPNTLALRTRSAAGPLAQLVQLFVAMSAREDGPGPADSLTLSAASALHSPAPTQLRPSLHK